MANSFVRYFKSSEAINLSLNHIRRKICLSYDFLTMHSRSQTADEIADHIDVRTGPQPLSYELQVGRKASVTNRLLAL